MLNRGVSSYCFLRKLLSLSSLWLTSKINLNSAQRNMGFSCGTSGKEPSCQYRRYKRLRFNKPRSGSSPGERHGNPLWHSCLGKYHGQRSLVGSWVAKNQTQLKWLNTHAPKETDVCDPWHNSQKASFWDTQIWVLILALSVTSRMTKHRINNFIPL